MNRNQKAPTRKRLNMQGLPVLEEPFESSMVFDEAKSDKASTLEESEADALRRDIEYEEKLVKALEENYKEMIESTKELESCLNYIDKENNEWKSRYENQIEINRHYAQQRIIVDKSLEDLKNRMRNTKTVAKIPADGVKRLEEEKRRIFSELSDYRWRLEQEDKIYHTANDERKEILMQLNEARGALNVVNMKVGNSQSSNLKSMSFTTNGDSLASDSKNTFLSISRKDGSGRQSEQFDEDENTTTEFELLTLYENKQKESQSIPKPELKLPRISLI